MDSNKYRRSKGIKYKDSTLSEEKSEEFLNRINKRGERKCIAIGNRDVVCEKVFMSEGAHNRKCPECNREEYASPLVYRINSGGARSTAFHAEIGE